MSLAVPARRDAPALPTVGRTTPYLHLDLATALRRFDELAAALPDAEIHYAVRATRPRHCWSDWSPTAAGSPSPPRAR